MLLIKKEAIEMHNLWKKYTLRIEIMILHVLFTFYSLKQQLKYFEVIRNLNVKL